MEQRAPRGAHSGDVKNRPKGETLLAAWMEAQGMSVNRFKKMLGCHERTVRLWRDGRILPSLPYAYFIDEMTQGAVPVASWLGTDIGRAAYQAIRKGAGRGG